MKILYSIIRDQKYNFYLISQLYTLQLYLKYIGPRKPADIITV